jgi:hypothetical protein
VPPLQRVLCFLPENNRRTQRYCSKIFTERDIAETGKCVP